MGEGRGDFDGILAGDRTENMEAFGSQYGEGRCTTLGNCINAWTVRPISHCREYSQRTFVASTRSEYSERVLVHIETSAINPRETNPIELNYTKHATTFY